MFFSSQWYQYYLFSLPLLLFPANLPLFPLSRTNLFDEDRFTDITPDEVRSKTSFRIYEESEAESSTYILYDDAIYKTPWCAVGDIKLSDFDGNGIYELIFTHIDPLKSMIHKYTSLFNPENKVHTLLFVHAYYSLVKIVDNYFECYCDETLLASISYADGEYIVTRYEN